MISHGEAQALTSARLDGALDPVAERELVAHLATCASCRAFAEQSNALVSGLRELPYLPASPTVSRAVHAYISKPRTPWAKLGTLVPLQGMPAFSAIAAALIVIIFSVFVYTRVDRTGTPLDPGNGDSVSTEVGGLLEAPSATVSVEITEEAVADDADAESNDARASDPDQPTQPAATDEAESDGVSTDSTSEPEATESDDSDGGEAETGPADTTSTTVPEEPTDAPNDPAKVTATNEPDAPTETPDPDVTGQGTDPESTEDNQIRSLLPSESPAETAAPTETVAPNETPVPTDEPTAVPTDEPTETPESTDEPTETVAPTDEPTETPEPTEEPTETPEPTAEPTETPEPTAEPTETPEPTAEPTETPEPTIEPTEEDESPGILPIDGTFATTDEDPDGEQSPDDPTQTPEDSGVNGRPTGDTESEPTEPSDEDLIEPSDDTTNEDGEPTDEPEIGEPTAEPGIEDPAESSEEINDPTEEPIEGGDNQIEPIDGTDAGRGGGENEDGNQTPSDEESNGENGSDSEDGSDGEVTPIDDTEETDGSGSDGQTTLSDVSLGEQFSSVSGDPYGRLAIAPNGDLVLDSNLDIVSTVNANGLSLEQTETDSGIYVAVCNQNGDCVSSEPVDPADPSNPVLETATGWLGNSAIYERIQGDTVSYRTFQVDSGSLDIFSGAELLSGGNDIESTQNGAYIVGDGILIPGLDSWVFLSPGGNSGVLGPNPFDEISLVRTAHADGQITYVGDGQLVLADLNDPGNVRAGITIGLVDYDLAPSGDRFVISTGTEILIIDFSGNVLAMYVADEGRQIGSVLWLNRGIAYVDLGSAKIELIPEEALP